MRFWLQYGGVEGQGGFCTLFSVVFHLIGAAEMEEIYL